jgi:hypothetical protein
LNPRRKIRAKKEAFRRGVEGFFVFRGLSWSQAQNERGFTVRVSDWPACATPPALRAYFFLPLVVDFLLEDLLEEAFFAELFLVAMALVPPFSAAQSKER